MFLDPHGSASGYASLIRSLTDRGRCLQKPFLPTACHASPSDAGGYLKFCLYSQAAVDAVEGCGEGGLFPADGVGEAVADGGGDGDDADQESESEHGEDEGAEEGEREIPGASDQLRDDR